MITEVDINGLSHWEGIEKQPGVAEDDGSKVQFHPRVAGRCLNCGWVKDREEDRDDKKG